MTSSLIRSGIYLTRLLIKGNIDRCSLPSIAQAPLVVLQARNAGHAKWQNIAKTKSTNDAHKAKLFSRYVMMVRRAVLAGGRQPNPKLNTKLADVLAEANKMNVPKATLERAIDRAMNVKIINTNLDIQGPGGSVIIARCETDNINLMRRDVKKILKKFDSHLLQSDSMISMFQSRGFIRTSSKTRDNREVDENFAEEAAIHAGAEDFSLEEFDDTTDESLAKVWVFQTDAVTMNQCRGELDKLGLNIISSDLELVPYRAVDYGGDTYEKVLELIEALREHDHVVDVFHNVAAPSET